MGGQLLLSYSSLFCATCLDVPECVDGLWDYGGRIHRSAWFPASVDVTAGEAGVLSRDGWSTDQNGGVARAVPTPERCRGRSSCVSDRARRYWVPRGEYRGCRVAYGGRMRLCRPVREAYEHRGVLDVHKSTQAPPACVRISRSSDGFPPGWRLPDLLPLHFRNFTFETVILRVSTVLVQNTRQSDRCNGGVFPAILNLPLLDSFVPSSHRPDHRRYPRRAFAMISCAPSGD
uniref:(northern house mosquito) hypothetical protein n=1 Tax=Culex pipiens TaxID=7175 RepID=A0A8D8J8F8_CULPI